MHTSSGFSSSSSIESGTDSWYTAPSSSIDPNSRSKSLNFRLYASYSTLTRIICASVANLHCIEHVRGRGSVVPLSLFTRSEEDDGTPHIGTESMKWKLYAVALDPRLGGRTSYPDHHLRFETIPLIVPS